MEEMRILKVLSNDTSLPTIQYQAAHHISMYLITQRKLHQGIFLLGQQRYASALPTAARTVCIHLPDPTQEPRIHNIMGPLRDKILYSPCEMHFSSKSSRHPYAAAQLDTTARNGAYMHVEGYSSSTIRQRRLTSTQNPL